MGNFITQFYSKGCDFMTLEKKGARCIDRLGRVVITSGVRKDLGLESGTYVEFFVDYQQNCVIIKKYNDACALCGSNSGLVEMDGKYLCKGCVDKISGLG